MADLRPIVYHVGRAGDVPGGMTQVVNAYLAWRFDECDVKVIESRGNPGDHLTAAKLFARALRTVRTIARSKQPAVIVVHLSERGSFVREGWIARYAHHLGLPVIAHMHGADFAAFEAENSALVGRVLAASDRVISLSDETSAICAAHIGADRVALVPNAIPVGTPVEKERLVVFGGVVSHRKGIDVLQSAWRAAQPTEPWRLVVAGPIRDDRLVDPDLPRADFAGSLDHDSLMDLLDRAAVSVLPSRDEAMPMFILESMARRAAVISTRVGGIPDVLADDCGILIDPGDADALTAALVTMMADDDAREAIADAGFARFEARYSASSVFPRVERIWLDPLGRTGPDGSGVTGNDSKTTKQPVSTAGKGATK
ncbi:glycosyltransferase family 4 protein [Microbacterium sp. BK668]|uniref:glycosyltransferase family 4 protein n=1 Tax=Microbacterium sp. BK668 TaxID=2512118 RepID=UPI0010D64526|nr:glycosyltransferase family 4 protein [Microbacterium sp. BK668]TDN90554.1 glycosyltransferase involved in cell wall biosynthesis [Microbacterium sp. BK668]